MEQRFNLKFFVKIRKSSIQYFKVVTEVYGEEDVNMSLRTHKRLESGREEVEEDPKSERQMKISAE